MRNDKSKYGIPIYTQDQMDSLSKAYFALLTGSILLAFSFGFIVGRFSISDIVNLLR